MRFLIVGLVMLGLAGKLIALERKQANSIEQIVEYSKKYVDNRGYNYKTLLVAIAYVESSFCKYNIGDVHKGRSILNASLGCFQFQLETAKFIINKDRRLKKFRSLSDWQIANKLIGDLEFQTMLASYYVQWLLQVYGRKGLWHYNGSPAYQSRLEKAILKIKKYIRRR